MITGTAALKGKTRNSAQGDPETPLKSPSPLSNTAKLERNLSLLTTIHPERRDGVKAESRGQRPTTTSLAANFSRALSVNCEILKPTSKNAPFLDNGGKYWVSPTDPIFNSSESLRSLLNASMQSPNFKLNGGKIFLPSAFDHAIFSEQPGPVRGRYRERSPLSGKIRLPPLIDPFDLNNLIFVHPGEVLRVHSELEKLAQNRKRDQPIALVFSYGGTIAGKRVLVDGTSTVLPQLDGEFLIGAAGDKARQYQIVSSCFPTLIDSSQMRGVYLRDLLIMLAYVWRNSSDALKSNFVGALVPHGTDTKEWSAAKFSFMAGPDLPFGVAFVSSQRRYEEPGSDVTPNILLGLESLHKMHATHSPAVVAIMGGLMGGALFGPAIRKISDKSALSFSSEGYPMLVKADNLDAPIHNAFRLSYTPAKVWRPVIIQRFFDGNDFSIQLCQDLDPAEVYKRVREMSSQVVNLIAYGSHTAQDQTIIAASKACAESKKRLLISNVIPGALGGHRYSPALALAQVGTLLGMPPHAVEAKYALAHELTGGDPRLTGFVVDFMSKRDYLGEQIPRPEEPNKSPSNVLGTVGLEDLLPTY